MADSPESTLSNLPQKISLSGLASGDVGSFSGQGQGSGGLSGSPSAGAPFGMEGGIGLDLLSQLLQLQDTSQTGAPNTTSLLSPIGQGGLGAGAIGQQGIAGQIGGTTGGATAGQSGGTSADPAAILAKLLGVVKTGVSLASPTTDGTQQGTTSSGPDQTASPVTSDLSPGQPILTAGQTSNLPQGSSADFAAFGGTGQESAQIWSQLKAAGLSDSELQALGVTGPEMGGGFNTSPIGSPAGAGGLGGSTLSGTTLGGGTNLGGAIQGGLGAGAGLLNILQAAQSGNVPGGVGGGLQTVGGLAQLLKGLSPETLQSLGLGGVGTAGSGIGNTSLLGDIGGVAGGLGGLLGIAGGVQGLVNGTGSPGQEISQLGGGALSLYSSLSTLFPDVFPSLTGALSNVLGIVPGAGGSILGGVGTGVASTVGAEVGTGAAGAGTAVGTGAGGGLAGAGAGVAGGVAALPALAIELAQMISSIQDENKAARALGIRVKDIGSQLPGELQQLGSIPSLTSQITPGMAPDQAASLLKQLNDIQTGFQQGGWEDYAKTGSTTVGGGTDGRDLTAQLPGVAQAIDKFIPQIDMMDVGRMRLEDMLGQAGWSPAQIAEKAGSYIDPFGFANMLNAVPVPDGNFMQRFAGGPGPFREALFAPGLQTTLANPNFSGGVTGQAAQAMGLDPNVQYSAQDIANYTDPRGGGGVGSLTQTPYGLAGTQLWNQLNAIQPGNFEKGIEGLLANYGGVESPIMQQLLGVGPTPQPLQNIAQPPLSGFDPNQYGDYLYGVNA